MTDLRATFSPDVVSAIEALVDERIASALAGAGNGFQADWLSVGEAATHLGVSRRSVERLVADGRIRSATLARRRLLRRDDLDAYVQTAAREE